MNPQDISPSVLLIAGDRVIGNCLAAALEEIGCGVILASMRAALQPSFLLAPDVVMVDVAAAEAIDPVQAGNRIGGRLAKPVIYLVDDDLQASRVREQVAKACLVRWPFPSAALDRALQEALYGSEATAGESSCSLSADDEVTL